jgi:hypothetical protein
VSWDELLAALVSFVGRQVHTQVWSDSDPESSGAVVVCTTFGTFSGTDGDLEQALPADTLLVTLKGSDGEVSGVLSISRSALVEAKRLDADRVEVVLGSTMLGIYAD